MNIKDYPSIILGFIGLTFLGKLIEDNIPNLNYKKIIKFLKRHYIPILLMSYLGLLYIALKVTGSKQLKTSYSNVLLVVVLAIAVDKLIKRNSAPPTEATA